MDKKDRAGSENENQSYLTECENIEVDNCGIGEDILQFFNNLNWDVVDPPEYKSCLKSFRSIQPTPCHVKGLIDGNLYPFPVHMELAIDQKLNEGVQVSSYYVPGVEDATVVYTQSSELNYMEQLSLYKFMCMNQYQRPLNESESYQYQELLKKATPEHIGFQTFVKWEWVRHNYQRSLEIPHSVQEYINRLWKTKVDQCLAVHPHIYKGGLLNSQLAIHIPLALNDPNQNHSVLELKNLLKTDGSIFKLFLPSLKSRKELVTDLALLGQLKQVSPEPQVEPFTHSPKTVCMDPRVSSCIENNNIDIVITASGIKTIVDNYNNLRDWLLPVTIRCVPCGKQNKKVVIVGKRLPPKAMSVYDKNVWHAKIASKWALKLTNKSVFGIGKPAGLLTSNLNSSQSFEEPTPMEIDEFGVDGGGTPSYSNEETADIESGSKVLLGNNNEDIELPREYRHIGKARVIPVTGKRSCSPTYHNPAGELDTCMINTKDESPKYIIKKTPGYINPCVEYTLWELRKSTHYFMAKTEQRTLTLLVRSKVDGIMDFAKNNQHQYGNVHISSKLEYQPEYGASKMSMSELLREYIDLYIRQDTTLCRVRIVGHTKELMLLEMKTLAEIKECLHRLYNVQTEKVFDPLYAVLTKLIDLPVGHYLLHHSVKMGHFVELLSESPSEVGYNISLIFEKPVHVDVNLPAMEIDPFLVTAVHHRAKHPPGLFNPKMDNNNARFLKKTGPKFVIPPKGNKKTRRKKKKKKKTLPSPTNVTENNN